MAQQETLILSSLKNYLVGRRQKVVINGYSSTWCEVSSGVPQRSVLGPLLSLSTVILNSRD